AGVAARAAAAGTAARPPCARAAAAGLPASPPPLGLEEDAEALDGRAGLGHEHLALDGPPPHEAKLRLPVHLHRVLDGVGEAIRARPQPVRAFAQAADPEGAVLQARRARDRIERERLEAASLEAPA